MIHMETPWNATVGDELRQGSPEPLVFREKKRKFDQPLARPSLLRRDAHGNLVPWIQTQRVMDEFVEDPRTGIDVDITSDSEDLLDL